MQRLHVDDLAGILIEQGWPKLVLPAIATEAADGLTSGRTRPDVPFSLGPFTGLSCEITALTNLSPILLRA